MLVPRVLSREEWEKKYCLPPPSQTGANASIAATTGGPASAFAAKAATIGD